MNAQLIELWDRGASFSFKGESFRSREHIRDDDIWSVGFANSEISDDDIQHILNLKQLYSLNLSFTAISDVTIRAISHSLEIKELNLRGTAITDACIESLIDMKSLLTLNLIDTQLSIELVAKLRRELPNAEIYF